MGGKSKQSQRTKNNARPSSSGRSAELLSGVKLDSGIVNIGGTQLPALFPSLVAPSFDPLISPELQLCLKKLNKKDPITKTKALQELSELVTNSNVDDVVSALSSWSHFYKILTVDPDRKVRECTQACHGTIVGACGRRVAPHLKQLMPAWLQAQADEHAPAQAHAQASLAKTFPDAKLPEVLSFCKEPIMCHLLEVLVGSGEPAHMKKAEPASAEERQLQVLRARVSALHGLRLAARLLPAPQHAWLRAQLQALLGAAAFWDLARPGDADARLRAAWFGAVGSIVSRFKGEFGAEHGGRTLRVLLAGRESNPLAAAQLWECLLSFMHNVPDWYQYLEKKELLTKRILDVLESGGWGDARHLSSMLLPLLASLPEEVLTKDFHAAFFNAIFSGLEKKSILSSKSERQYWITGLDECLRYLSTQARAHGAELVSGVHRAWLEAALARGGAQARGHLLRYSAARMAKLVEYWLKQAEDGNDDKYEPLIGNFWRNVGSTLAAQIDKLPPDRDVISETMDAHILLLQTLKSSFDRDLKKQHSIKFEADAGPAEPRPPARAQPPDPAGAERYHRNLNEVAREVCGHYLEFASEKRISEPVVSPLITLLLEFDDEALFAGIARRFRCASAFELYDSVLRPWLAGDAMRGRAVLDVVFAMMKHMSEPERDATFDTFRQFPPAVVEWAMTLALSHPHSEAGAARRWLRGEVAARTLAGATDRLVRSGDGAARALLLACLDGPGAVGPEAAREALRRLGAGLRAADGPLEPRARVAARLAAARAPCPALLAALLDLTAALQRGDPRLSPDTWREVRDAWQDGAAGLPPAERERFLLDAVDILHAHLDLRENLTEKPPPNLESSMDGSPWLDPAGMAHIASLGPHLVWRGAALAVSEAAQFSRSLLARLPAEPPLVRACAVRLQLLTDNLACPLDDDPVTASIASDTLTELSKDDLVTYVNTALFRLMYLRAMFLHRADDESDGPRCRELLADEYFEEQFVKCLHDYTVIDSLYEGYAFWPHYKLIEQSKTRMDTLLDDIITEIGDDIGTKISNTLSELAIGEGYFWAYSRRSFEDKTKGDERSGRNDKDLSQSDGPSSRSEVETGQVDGGNSEIVESENIEIKSTEEKVAGEEIPPLITNLQDLITGPELLHTLHYLQANAKNSSDESEVIRTEYYVMLASVYLAHAHEPGVARGLLRDAAGGRACSPDVIIDAYYAHNHTMLYDRDVSGAAWRQVLGNAAVCSFLAARLPREGWAAPAHHWDFTNITLCSILTSVELSKRNWGTAKVALLALAALRLLGAAERFVRAVPERSERAQPAPHVAALPAEWRDIYEPDLQHSVFSLVVHVLESGSAELSAARAALLAGLLRAAPLLRWEALSAAHRAGAFALRRLVAVCTAALREPVHSAFKFLAYEVLKVLLKPLVLEDAEQLAAWSLTATEDQEAEGRPLQLTLLYYDDAFFHLQDIVETAVSHVRVCEEVCSMVPFTDAHSLALGWLLLADVVSQQCQLARGDLTHQYIQIYRERQYTEPLLTTALRLLPRAVLAQAAPAARAAAWFARAPRAEPLARWCGAAAVARAACRAAWWCVRGAGAGGARGWRGAAPPRHARLLDELTARYITPGVVREEFALLQGGVVEDAEVTVDRSASEVTCVLTVDERPIELTVALSRQHPLVLPRLRADHSAAGNTNWILMYLGYQNGTILHALRMWAVSVNNKLERAPQCYICYCRLHHATGRLPGVHCHTCRNKFHNVCLRKWFLTSSKMTCPLCRANF